MKNKYRIRNWSKYNAGLKLRGSITFWLSTDAVEEWLKNEKTGKRGASATYSDTAIATMSTIKSVFSLAGRQSEGFVKSVFELMNLDLPVPDHSTVSRRLGNLEIKLPVNKSKSLRHALEGIAVAKQRRQSPDCVVDSTGVKVYGEGEWKTRQHGICKRNSANAQTAARRLESFAFVWRKLHLGIDESTGEIISAVVTTNDYHDSQVLEDILNGVEDEISQVSADGAYDTNDCYGEITHRQARAAIPPRKNAKIQQHGNCQAAPLQRDENLRAIRQMGRKKWKRDSNYHRRSLAETTQKLRFSPP